MADKSRITIDNNASNPDEIVNMIDNMMMSGTSRLKVNISEDLDAGTFKKAYHHGRCDINSPYACGTVFDLLEDNE